MRIAVLGAGGPAGVNTCRALANHEVIAVDENPDHLVWCEPYAETRYLPAVSTRALNDMGVDVDVILPQPDSLTMWTADHAENLDARTFLPDRRTVALCQDKFEAGLCWRRTGLREDRIELDDGNQAQYESTFPAWVRARHGAGAKAAALCQTYIQAALWIGFWHWRDRTMDFIIEEYLPGRDYAWSGIYYQGNLVCSFARERLEYLYPGLTPEGLTGTPTIARIIKDDHVNFMAEESVYAVDQRPHGIFSVDLKEDEHGVPRPTEINAGRGFTTFGLWATKADYNLFDIVVELAVERTSLEYPDEWRDCLPEGLTLYRHIDCGHVFRPDTKQVTTTAVARLVARCD